VYVDDIIIIGSPIALIQQLTVKFHAAFSQFGHLHYFLGLEIKYLPDQSLVITKVKYIQDLLHKNTKRQKLITFISLWIFIAII